MTWEEFTTLSGNLIRNSINTWTSLSYESIPYDLIRDIFARPIITSLITWIWWIVCLCVIFKKANRQRWEALIPVWNVRIIFKIAWMQNAFRLILLTPIFFSILAVLTLLINQADLDLSILTSIIAWICWILCIASFIICIITPIKLARKFSQPGIFWVWLLFVYPIFIGILAFDKECIYIQDSTQSKDFESKNLLK